MDIKNTSDLIKARKLIEDGYNYITDDGRVILRVLTGRRGTLKWQVEGKDFLYRSLFEAYFDLKY